MSGPMTAHAAVTRGIERALADLGVDLVGCSPSVLSGHVIKELRSGGLLKRRRIAEQDAIIGEKAAPIADLRAELAELRVLAFEVRKYWRDWPQVRRDAVHDLSRFLAGAIEDLASSPLSRWDAEHPEGGAG